MTYQRTRPPLAGTVTDVASAAINVVSDPCLFDAAKIVNQLHNIDSGTSGGPTVGIGLCSAMPTLNAVLWVKQNPWIVPVGIAGAIGLIGLVAYRMGQDSRPRVYKLATHSPAVNPARARRRRARARRRR
jgi:hypothetical protein